jgi:hypothetical protein
MSLTNDVDNATSDDSPLATDDIGGVTSDESTEESTSREDRSDERQVAALEGGSQAGGLLGEDVGLTLDEGDEDAGASDTVDVTGIVTEEDTTERGECAHEVGLPGDGSLNALDIVSSGETPSGRGGGGDVVAVLLHVGGCSCCYVDCRCRSGVCVGDAVDR